MLDLLRWHGAEEIEHRSLVFDVYQNVCGNYALRALTMLLTAQIFVHWWIAGVRFLMAQDPTISAKRAGETGCERPAVPGAGTVAGHRDGAEPLHSARPSPQRGGVHTAGDGLLGAVTRGSRRPQTG